MADALISSLASAGMHPEDIDFVLAAGAGRIPGNTTVTAFGYSDNVASGVATRALWELAEDWIMPLTAVSVELLSDSASDGVAGTGARQVRITGVDANFAVQVEVITMNGTTPVASALTWRAINNLIVVDDATAGYGSNRANVGNITARIPGPGATQAHIAAGRTTSLLGRFTVPAGHTWLINNFFFNGNAAGSPNASYHVAARSFTPTGLMVSGLPLTMQNGQVLQIALPKTPVPIAEKRTFMFVIVETSAAGMDISVGCTGILSINPD